VQRARMGEGLLHKMVLTKKPPHPFFDVENL
jgi:hypothetical protein